MKLKVGGQCEGYGGLFMALQQHLDVEHAWYAEIDLGASKVLAHHYPGVPNHGDITNPLNTGPYGLPRRHLTAPRRARQAVKRHARRVDGWRRMAESVDVFTSGFPCQGFSVAGKRRGSTDERHLWPTGVLPAIEALMPPLVVLENVPGLLTIEKGAVFGRVLADLDGLGYAVSWTTVGACKVGACHHRHRVFIAATLAETRAPMSDPVAHRVVGGWVPAQSVLFGDAGAVRWPAAGFTSAGVAWELPADVCGAGSRVFPTPKASDTGTAGRRASEGWRPPLSEVLISLLPTPRVSDTSGAGVHGNGGLDLRTAVSMLPTPLASDARQRISPGDQARKSPALEAVFAMLPSPVAADSDRVSETYGRGNPTLLGALLPTPRASDGVKGGPNQRGSSGDVMLPAAVQPERFGKYAQAVRRHELAYSLVVPEPTEPDRNNKPRLSPAFPEWMQGLKPGHLTNVVGRKDALRLAGNGVNWLQGAFALPTLPTFRAFVASLVGVAA